MRGLFTFVLLSLPLLSFAEGNNGTVGGTSCAAKKHHNSPKRYTLTEMHKGKDFFNGWNFWSWGDPTHGNANYLGRKEATRKNLAYVRKDGVAVLAVDSTTHLKKGGKRDSVRLTSKAKYNGGLFIADFRSMPTGCGLWPSWWSSGAKWPDAGEIDVIEAVNTMTNNQMSLHTTEGCTWDTKSFTPKGGRVIGTQCAVGHGHDIGCGFVDPDKTSFGHGFNKAGGGVYAHEWNDDGIKIWHFDRKNIPKDIDSSHPDPSKWPAPKGVWSSATCNMKKHFYDHGLILNTELCGEWAGRPGSFNPSCPGSCADYVADPTHFKDAKWEVNYIAVYQQK